MCGYSWTTYLSTDLFISELDMVKECQGKFWRECYACCNDSSQWPDASEYGHQGCVARACQGWEGTNKMKAISMWSSYDRIWFSGPDKQEIFILKS
jgi:hypothetical protein